MSLGSDLDTNERALIRYRRVALVTLVAVYFLFLVGASVRASGAGMGCPDWPKCFGYYIPPSEVSEIKFQPNRAYKEGQVIIVDETLQVAASDFTSADFSLFFGNFDAGSRKAVI